MKPKFGTKGMKLRMISIIKCLFIELFGGNSPTSRRTNKLLIFPSNIFSIDMNGWFINKIKLIYLILIACLSILS